MHVRSIPNDSECSSRHGSTNGFEITFNRNHRMHMSYVELSNDFLGIDIENSTKGRLISSIVEIMNIFGEDRMFIGDLYAHSISKSGCFYSVPD